jgi:excisionase family DNA binding protein
MEAFMAIDSPLPRPTVPVATPQPASAAGPEFLTTEEAADYLRLSPRTLEKQRVLGGGPRFRKFGARVLYARDDLRRWADSRAYGMTSDPGITQRASVR